MSDQISEKDRVWELTPTEFKVAHLSLHLSRRGIAESLVLTTHTVSTHLKHIFEKLELRGEDKDQRLRLRSRYGDIIETIFMEELHKNYYNYEKQKRAYVGRRLEILRQRVLEILRQRIELAEIVSAHPPSEQTAPEFPAIQPTAEHEQVLEAHPAEQTQGAPTEPTSVPSSEPTEETTTRSEPTVELTIITERTGEPISTTSKSPPAEGTMFEPPPVARPDPWRGRFAGRASIIIAFVVISVICLFFLITPLSIPPNGSQTPSSTQIAGTQTSIAETADAASGPSPFPTHTQTATRMPQPTSTGTFTPSSTPVQLTNTYVTVTPTQKVIATPGNVALGKVVRVNVLYDEYMEGDIRNITDGDVEKKVGWANEQYDEEMTVQVTIDLSGTFQIFRIRYIPGHVSRLAWVPDTMETPFGRVAPTVDAERWTEMTGNVVTSELTIIFTKTRTEWDNDWLYIGEIEAYGIPQ